MTRRRCRNHDHPEQGSTLVLALVFLSLFGLLLSSLLGFTSSSLLISARARAGAAEVYASDGAISAAINYYRENPELGGDDASCPGLASVPSAAGSSGLPAVTAECSESTSDLDGAAAVPALVAYGADAGEGVRVNGEDLRLAGDVLSNSVIDVAGPGRLEVFGDATAVGGCTGRADGVVSARPGGEVDCDADPVPVPIAHQELVQTSVPARTAVPACVPEQLVVTVSPGTYDDLLALNALTSGAGPCAGKTVHFTPGGYYFDFASCDDDPAACEWRVAPGATVVGGTAGPDLATAPTCEPDGPGVQLVFGGDSRLSVQGTVELCGEGDEPVIYGLAGTPPISYRMVGTPRSVADGEGGGFFSTPENARAIDGETSAASLEAADSATIEFDFDPVLPPAGGRVELAALRVAHRETGYLDDLDLTLTVTAGPQVVDAPAGAFTKAVALHEDQIDLTDLLADVEGALAGQLSVSFTATRADDTEAVEHLDGIELAVAHRVPAPPAAILTEPAASATSADGTFADAPNAMNIDGTSATAALTEAAPTAAIQLDFSSPALPRGARIEKVGLRIAHAEDQPDVALAATVTSKGAVPQAETIADASLTATAPDEDRPDLGALGFDPDDLRAGLTVGFTATRGAADATATLDGIVLVVSYRTTTATDAGHTATSATSEPDPPEVTNFSPPDSGRLIDGVTAQAALRLPALTASIDLAFPEIPATVVPAGATIESAALRVVHRERRDTSGLTLSGQVRVPAAPNTPFAFPFGASGGFTLDNELHEDRIDLVGSGLNPGDVRGGMTVTFTATRASDGPELAALLDGIELSLAYTEEPAAGPAVYRGPTGDGCLSTAPYGTAPSACALLEVAGGATRFSLDGPVYAPVGAVDLALAGDSVAVDGGVVARTVHLTVAAAPPPPPEDPPPGEACPIQGEPGGVERQVTFTSEGVPITAEVTFTDTFVAPCGDTATEVEIDDWAVRP